MSGSRYPKAGRIEPQPLLKFAEVIKKNLVEIFQVNILDNMTNCKDLLAKELSILYPDVTDIELNEMTNNLIDFYITAVKVVLKDDNPLSDIDVS